MIKKNDATQNRISRKNQPEEASNKTRTRKAPKTKDSNATNETFLDIVREAVGENIQLPDCLDNPTTQTSNSNCDSSITKKSKTTTKRTPKPNNVIINVNYVFGNGPPTNQSGDVTNLVNETTCSPTRAIAIQPQQSNQISPSSANIVAYNYDFNLQQLEPVLASTSTENTNNISKSLIEHGETHIQLSKPVKSSKKRNCKIWPHRFNLRTRFGILKKRYRNGLIHHRQRRALKKHFLELFTAYKRYLQHQELSFKRSPLVLKYYKYFRALELYTNLLDDLKMFCRNAAAQSQPTTSSCSNNNTSSKRARTEDEACQNTSTARSRKLSRQEENLRNMLLPESAEDTNRKDAIYAFNFYEKVEEIFKTSNRSDDYEKFNSLLKSFNPKSERASDLYRKLEVLFLPDYPELAQVFLTFLLPSEATEIGKFFEHFMITNMTTFINKLNIYFNKQPAQIRKIYNCLSELAEDSDVTMKKVEEKILPLLKGNQFLIDWFMQQFPKAAVPERLLPAPEYVNLKEVQNNQTGEFMETMKDIMNSPNTDQQPACQLRYINGRIFYGSKMTLPTKLSFMAKKYTSKEENIATPGLVPATGCLHGIREYGEQRLAAAVATTSHNTNATTNLVVHNEAVIENATDKSEEDELSKALIIDTTAGSGDDSCSSIEACDDATLRAHAVRLNPSYYGNSCFSSVSASSAPYIGNSHQQYHTHTKKSCFNVTEDIKTSPRKMIAGGNSGISILIPDCSGPSTSSNIALNREKRRSPTKKVKSPNTATKARTQQQQQQQQEQPMVVIHQQHNSGPIVYAKKLKTLIESSGDEQNNSHAEQLSNKFNAPIIARVKQRSPIGKIDHNSSRITRVESDDNFHFPGKYENSDDMEFLPEHTPPHKKDAHKKMGFPRLHLNNMDSSTEECSSSSEKPQAQKFSSIESSYNVDVVSSTNVDSDEDCKLDIVATLATTVNQDQNEKNLAAPPTTTRTARFPLPIATTAFTRDEDKVILIEMKLGSSDRNELLQRISAKLPNRTISEISSRHEFLMDFLSKLQGKQ